jgi:hypothetical protein
MIVAPIQFDDLDLGDKVSVRTQHNGGKAYSIIGTFNGFEFVHCWKMKVVTAIGSGISVPTGVIQCVDRITARSTSGE